MDIQVKVLMSEDEFMALTGKIKGLGRDKDSIRYSDIQEIYRIRYTDLSTRRCSTMPITLVPIKG